MYKRLTTDVSGAHLLHLRREIPLDGPRLRAPHLLPPEGLAHREPLAVPCLLPQPAQQPAARDPRQVASLVHPLHNLHSLAHLALHSLPSSFITCCPQVCTPDQTLVSLPEPSMCRGKLSQTYFFNYERRHCNDYANYTNRLLNPCEPAKTFLRCLRDAVRCKCTYGQDTQVQVNSISFLKTYVKTISQNIC